MLTKIFILSAYLYACTAHVCMLSPPQRTALVDINKAGSGSCIQLDGPCGKTNPTMDKLHLMAGQNYTVVFQKNLDHFNAAMPGYWSVSIGMESGSMKELYRTPDTNTPSLTLFSATITIPNMTGMGMVIQTQYVTKNPQAPPVFYQCADVVVMA